MDKQNWKVWRLDAWGNAEEGCDVNDRSNSGTIELSLDADDNAILDAMIQEGYLAGGRKHFEIDADDDEIIFINRASDAMPMYQLERTSY